MTLQERAETVALRHGLSTTTFANLITSESQWNPAADNGQDRGLMQISRKYHPEVTDDCAFDADCSMEWAAFYIAENGWDEWVVCNCYLYAQVKLGVKLPLAQYIVPNSPPRVGAIAIMKFGEVIHYQVVTALDKDGVGFSYDGANRQPCNLKKGHDDFADERLLGFWYPPGKK